MNNLTISAPDIAYMQGNTIIEKESYIKADSPSVKKALEKRNRELLLFGLNCKNRDEEVKIEEFDTIIGIMHEIIDEQQEEITKLTGLATRLKRKLKNYERIDKRIKQIDAIERQVKRSVHSIYVAGAKSIDAAYLKLRKEI